MMTATPVQESGHHHDRPTKHRHHHHHKNNPDQHHRLHRHHSDRLQDCTSGVRKHHHRSSKQGVENEGGLELWSMETQTKEMHRHHHQHPHGASTPKQEPDTSLNHAPRRSVRDKEHHHHHHSSGSRQATAATSRSSEPLDAKGAHFGHGDRMDLLDDLEKANSLPVKVSRKVKNQGKKSGWCSKPALFALVLLLLLVLVGVTVITLWALRFSKRAAPVPIPVTHSSQPSTQDCRDIANGVVLDDHKTMITQSFSVDIDVHSELPEALPIIMDELDAMVQQSVLTTLAGCGDDNNLLPDQNYVVASGSANVTHQVNETCSDSTRATTDGSCFRVRVDIELYLKGIVPEQMLLIWIEEVFRRDLAASEKLKIASVNPTLDLSSDQISIEKETPSPSPTSSVVTTVDPSTTSPATLPPNSSNDGTSNPATQPPSNSDNRTTAPTTTIPTLSGTADPTTLSPTLRPSEDSSSTTKVLNFIGLPDPVWDYYQLNQCEGDCDRDSDCAIGLVCLQRDAGDDGVVPGCTGDANTIGTGGDDYCVLRPSDTYLSSVYDHHEGSDQGTFPIPLCSGDCDFDSDCEGDLVCYYRAGFDPVPGCFGEGEETFDYCVPPDTPNKALDFVGDLEWGYYELKECQGDCNYDSDCDLGLVCWQRSAGDDGSVPGCTGNANDLGTGSEDFCIVRPSDTFLVSWFDDVDGADFGIYPLPLCAGDCDTDEDCESGLVCFYRPSLATPVPGCEGPGEEEYGYCINP